MTLDSRSRWLALLIVCLGDLMIVLDVTIVGVALPSIQEDLGFSETSLAWVVNAYLLTFGGFLLLGGRLGDLFGHRRLFLARDRALHRSRRSRAASRARRRRSIGARAVQGVGGAIVSAVALSLIVTLFTEPGERAKAMGVFGFVAAGGGSIGVLLGGVLTDALDVELDLPRQRADRDRGRRVLSARAVRAAQRRVSGVRLDVAGAVTVTASLMVAVYAIVNGNEVGWASAQTLGLLGRRCCAPGSCSSSSSRGSESPLMPLAALPAPEPRGLERRRRALGRPRCSPGSSSRRSTCSSSSATARSRSVSPSCPGNIIMAVLSLGLSARLVMRFGIRMPLGVGLGLAAVGLLLFARAPVDGTFVVDVLPSMILLGLGAGMAFNPVLLAAMGDVRSERGGPRVGRRQHGVHDGRRARVWPSSRASRRRGRTRCSPTAGARRRGAHRRLPRSVPRRRDVRRRRGDSARRSCARRPPRDGRARWRPRGRRGGRVDDDRALASRPVSRTISSSCADPWPVRSSSPRIRGTTQLDAASTRSSTAGRR